MNGFELLEFRFPPEPLIRVTGDMPGARVCVGDLVGEPWRGGERAEAGRIAAPGQKLAEQYHFGLVYQPKAAAGIYSNSLYRKGTKPVQRGGRGLDGAVHQPSPLQLQGRELRALSCARSASSATSTATGVIDWKDAACFIHDSIPNRVKLRQDCIKYMLNHGVGLRVCRRRRSCGRSATSPTGTRRWCCSPAGTAGAGTASIPRGTSPARSSAAARGCTRCTRTPTSTAPTRR